MFDLIHKVILIKSLVNDFLSIIVINIIISVDVVHHILNFDSHELINKIFVSVVNVLSK